MSSSASDKNIVRHISSVTHAMRERLNGHRSFVLWFTGLSGSGKSTLAHRVESLLFESGCRTYVFDGDNVRHGLCSDLGFSAADRGENIRRAGEMCKLFMDAGVIALTAFISPFQKDRDRVREMVKPGKFIEVFCDASLEVCEERDVKGLYRRARRGEIPEFTGISSPYERPANAELTIFTGEASVDICARQVIAYLERQGKLAPAAATKAGIDGPDTGGIVLPPADAQASFPRSIADRAGIRLR